MDSATIASGPRATAGALDCHICLDAPVDAVATSCGHVFCWPCIWPLFQDEGKPNTSCPVCSTRLAIDTNLLALYGGATSADCSSDAVSSDSPALPQRPRNPCKFIPRLASGGGDCPELAGYAGALRHMQQAIARQKDRNDCLSVRLVVEQRNFEADMEELLKEQQQLVQQENLMILEEERLELELERALR